MQLRLLGDTWTRVDGAEVECLLIRRKRLDYRRRIRDNWLKVESPIESVLVSDNYLGEFMVQVHFAEAAALVADSNDAMILRMKAGWHCEGRFVQADAEMVLLLCPVVTGNGLPVEPVSLPPPPPRRMGIPVGRTGWQR